MYQYKHFNFLKRNMYHIIYPNYFGWKRESILIFNEYYYILAKKINDVVFLTGQDSFKHLKHSLYVCQKAKKLAATLGEIALKPTNRELLHWIQPVVNHFWYSCNTCKGNAEKLLKKWFTILHHVTNEHIWPGGR